MAMDVDRLREAVNAFEMAGKPTEGPTREAVLMQLGALTSQIGPAAHLEVPATAPGPCGGLSPPHSQASHRLQAGMQVPAEVTAAGQDGDVRFCAIPEHCPSAPPGRTQINRRSSPWRRNAPSCAMSERRTSRTGSARQSCWDPVSCAATSRFGNSGRSDTPVRDDVNVRRARSVGGGVAIPVRHTKASQLRQAALQSRTASPGSPKVSPRQSPERTQSPLRPPSRKGASVDLPSATSMDATLDSDFIEDSALDTSLKTLLESDAVAGSPASSPPSSAELGFSDGPRAGVAARVTQPLSLHGTLSERAWRSGASAPSPGSPLLSARQARVPGAPPPVSPAQLPRLMLRGSFGAPTPWPMAQSPYGVVYALR